MYEERINHQDVARLVESTHHAPDERIGEIHGWKRRSEADDEIIVYKEIARPAGLASFATFSWGGRVERKLR